MDYFSSQMTAKGYAQDRPYFHPIVIDKIRSYLGLKGSKNIALDVGCGAGLSTVALTSLADNVVGIDTSKEMIKATIKQKNVIYCNSSAEYLPFKNTSFDLITVCNALSWIERSLFFSEVDGVLCPNGWIIFYENFFQGKMSESTSFEKWYNSQYLVEYPKPSRNELPLNPSECQSYGFNFAHEELYTNEIEFTCKQYIAFLMTQSNITVKIRENPDSENFIRKWLFKTLAPIFNSSSKKFLFGGYIWYLQRA